jgi:type IV pilus assembly protein PilQ
MNPNHIRLSRAAAGFFMRSAPVYALCAMLASPALGQTPPTPEGSVQAQDYGGVSMSVQDTDLATVLQMLSIETKQNIIVGKSVSGTVSVNLYDVSFEDALKAILEPNGYTYYREGNFIYVITREEKEAIDKARRKTESRIFELEYLSAADATEFILPLLSDVGKAAGRGDVQPGIKPDVTDAGAESYAFSAKIVVNDYTENLDTIGGLLTELDTPPQECLVEATVLQTDLDEANAFGVDFTVLGSLNFSDLTSPLGAVNDLLGGENGVQPDDNNAQAASSTVGGTAGPAGLKIGIVSDDVSVFIRMLDQVTDSVVLARPKIMALNRQRAQVLVGARIGYLSTTATETTTTQTVEFLDTGVELVFRPFISRSGMIRLELSPSVSEASLRSVTDSNGATVTIPDELTNEVTTNVRVKDGETLVLGGLFRESTRTTRRQVPVLGDIPLVGAAFRGQDDQVDRQEIIFLITPSIVRDDVLWANGKQVIDSIDSVRVGARAGLLPFSNDKLTDNHNQKALDAYNRGDTDSALYHINNSLRLHPAQPEMIRLREKITGEKARVHEKGLMERVMHREMMQTDTVRAPAHRPEPVARRNGSQVQPQPSMMPDESPATEQASAELSEPLSMNQPSFIDESEMVAAHQPETFDGQAEGSPTMTPAQDRFYREYLYGLFSTLDMPELAACFLPDGSSEGQFYSTFDDMEQSAGATGSYDPFE